MLSLVTAAEHQYRHDTWTRERETAVLASIRERRESAAAALPAVAAPIAAPVERVAPRAKRAAWARPIGMHSSAECTTVACATA